jgi:APA family basic amino acid/polyamine antiporter
VLKGSGLLFIAFLGFDAVTTMAEESLDPVRDIPRASLGSLLTATVLYVGVSLVLSGLVLYSELDSDAALASVLFDLGYVWQGDLIAVCAVTSCTACTLCALIAQPRIYFRMSADGLLWPVFRKINEKTRTPIFSIVVTGVLGTVFAFFFTIEDLSTMISIGTLFCFSIVCLSVLVIRYRSMALLNWIVPYLFTCLAFSLVVNFGYYIYSLIPICVLILLGIGISRIPEYEEGHVGHFLVPLFPVIPLAGLACNAVVLGTMEAWAWARFGCWFVIGLFIYAGYGYKHSLLLSDKNYVSKNELVPTARTESSASMSM